MSELPVTGNWRAPDSGASAGAVPWPTIPCYEILQELGRGGMGVVYKARQVSSERLVALKLIRDGALAGPQERGRFRIEAEAAARMQHPNIVQIYEVGEHAGQPYFAMELVDGGSLDKHLAGWPLPPAQAAELVRTVALAVQHAHERKVIHRDLKPGNILLTPNPKSEIRNQKKAATDETPIEHGRVSVSDPCSIRGSASSDLEVVSDFGFRISDFSPKITDFSLAKRLDSDSTAWTRDGDLLGTASYMAPEQATGRVRDVGPAADVYALGAILYELLSGRPPFQADSWNQTVQQVLHDEPPLLTRLQPDVPRDLETVCLRCLEKEPNRRYPSALELANDLNRFLEGKPVTAVPLSETERLARLAARDGYQIVGEIGHGPQSIVYHALSGPLQQAVALKVFAAGVCTQEEWEARLRHAADLWAPLTHPHLVPFQRAGWWDGSPYLALEYVPHRSLADKLTGKPYSIRQALRMLEQLVEIVSYLHRQGVIHGNLKPSNVLLAADGIPRVVDFQSTGGLFQGPLPADDQESTGLVYLAPEQVRDPTAELRPHTDIYGLGLILYELLTGRPPFAASTREEMLNEVRFRDPVPPSRLNSHVTADLEGFCLRCLRKNPWRRYHRAFDLLRRLRHFLENPGERELA